MQPITRETFVDRRQSSIRWSAVFAGATVAVGLWIFLQVLGMGLGLSAIDTDDAGSLRNASIGTGVWSLVAPILALLAGGVVTARTGGGVDRVGHGIHALMMWAIATVLGVVAMVWVVTTLAGAAVTTGQVAAHEAVHDGAHDRGAMIDRLDARTELDRRDGVDLTVARERLARAGVRADRAERAERAQAVALTAADRAGTLMVWAALSMLLSLAAALGGAALGALGRRRDASVVGRPEHTTQQMWTPTS